MSWDYRVDEDGSLEIIVSRWYNTPPPNGNGRRVIRFYADGFEPNEPISVEVIGSEDNQQKYEE